MEGLMEEDVIQRANALEQALDQRSLALVKTSDEVRDCIQNARRRVRWWLGLQPRANGGESPTATNVNDDKEVEDFEDSLMSFPLFLSPENSVGEWSVASVRSSSRESLYSSLACLDNDASPPPSSCDSLSCSMESLTDVLDSVPPENLVSLPPTRADTLHLVSSQFPGSSDQENSNQPLEAAFLSPCPKPAPAPQPTSSLYESSVSDPSTQEAYPSGNMCKKRVVIDKLPLVKRGVDLGSESLEELVVEQSDMYVDPTTSLSDGSYN